MYTHTIENIYLTLSQSAQVAVGTFFMIYPVPARTLDFPVEEYACPPSFVSAM